MQLHARPVERQLGRPPIPPVRVACRCTAGWPVVVEQPERGPDGEPFPTAFWLSCPGLVKAVSRIEGAGGVRALEERLADDLALAAAFFVRRTHHEDVSEPVAHQPAADRAGLSRR